MPSDWERVADDPALLRLVRERYTGAGDVLDQLWWLEHPGTLAPSGAEDPAALIERARRDLYRPGGEAAGAAALQRRADAVDGDRAAARRAARSAVSEVRIAHEPADPGPDPATGAPATTPVRRPRWFPVVAVLAGVLLVGAGFLLARLSTPQAPALQVFDRAQTAADRPPGSAPLPPFVDRGSLRHLLTSSTSGTVLYAAHADDGRVCLVAEVLALDYRVTCTSAAGFAAGQLSLSFETAVDPDDDSGVIRDQRIDPTWLPSGLVHF